MQCALHGRLAWLILRAAGSGKAASKNNRSTGKSRGRPGGEFQDGATTLLSSHLPLASYGSDSCPHSLACGRVTERPSLSLRHSHVGKSRQLELEMCVAIAVWMTHKQIGILFEEFG